MLSNSTTESPLSFLDFDYIRVMCIITFLGTVCKSERLYRWFIVGTLLVDGDASRGWGRCFFHGPRPRAQRDRARGKSNVPIHEERPHPRETSPRTPTVEFRLPFESGYRILLSRRRFRPLKIRTVALHPGRCLFRGCYCRLV